VAPTPLGAIEAPYPAGAHGSSEVALELVIAEDGSVTSSSVREGAPPFAETARRAAEAFRFQPATRNGIPVKARIALKIVFREPSSPDLDPESSKAERPRGAAQAPAKSMRRQLERGKAPPAVGPEVAATEIVVLGEQRGELGSIRIPREEARRVPGAFGDPFRVVEVLPGVAPVLSGLPYFYVRGAPPGSVGYFIDGIKVPLLFHVGPGPSVIAPALVDRVELFPGAYPARFGHYAGAILAGDTAAPSERSHAEAQARIFDASAMVEQPFAAGRGSVALGGRYSYMQAILAAVAPDYELGYGDYQARIAYATSKRDRISLFAFGAFDRLRNKEQGLTLFDVGFQRLDLRWDRAHEKGRIRLGATASLDSVMAAPEDIGAPGTRQRSRGARLRAELEQDLDSSLRVRGGGDFGAERVEGEQEQVGGGFRAYPTRTDLAGGAYVDLVWRPSRSVEIVPGARLDLQRSRGESYTFFEPRLSTRTRLMQGVAYLAGFGLAHQLPATAVRVPGQVPTLLELSRQESIQATQGVEYALFDGMLGRTTLFHQYVDISEPGVHGRSFGVEQFIRRDFTRRLGGFLSYTLSRAEGHVGSRSVLSSYDRPHVLSAVLGYDLGRGFRLGARGHYASGRAFNVDCPTPDCGPGDPRAQSTTTRQLRLPGFFRLDLRFEKRWQLESGFWLTGTAEWFNALMASETNEVLYTGQGLRYEKMSPLTLPSLGVELGW
jgi:TonB family protein